MKIVCLFGSPRENGNSTTLAKYFCEAAKKRGAEVKTYNLNTLNYKGCQGCLACKTGSDKCVVKDDLEAALDDVFNCDVWLMSTPTYFGDVTSQLKAFIDRTFSYAVPDFLTNPIKSRFKNKKKLVFVQTQACPDENVYKEVYKKYSQFFKECGVESYLIRGCGLGDVGDVNKHKELFERTDEVVNQLFET